MIRSGKNAKGSFNAEGPDGLVYRKAPGKAQTLTAEHRAALTRAAESGPGPLARRRVDRAVLDVAGRDLRQAAPHPAERHRRPDPDFDAIADYRRFVDELVGRHKARNRKRIDAERAVLRPLPPRRAEDGEEAMVTVTSSGGFMLRKVFYTVPSRLIGHRLRVRIHDDRLEVFLGGTRLMTLPRGRGYGDRRRAHVVDYRHVIHALRAKPMALPGLVYRDQLFPRDAYRRLYDAAMAALPEKAACRLVVERAGARPRARLRGRSRRAHRRRARRRQSCPISPS